MKPIQLAALEFVAERRVDLREISEPMRQRIIDLAMVEPPLVEVDADQVALTEVGAATLANLKAEH